ncbi:hypothetical protein ACFXPJ_38235, partial [Streptomyces goshikiensis]
MRAVGGAAPGGVRLLAVVFVRAGDGAVHVQVVHQLAGQGSQESTHVVDRHPRRALAFVVGRAAHHGLEADVARPVDIVALREPDLLNAVAVGELRAVARQRHIGRIPEPKSRRTKSRSPQALAAAPAEIRAPGVADSPPRRRARGAEVPRSLG